MISALEKELSGTISNQVNDTHKTPDSVLLYIGSHNVIRVMLKRPLRKSNPAAAFLHITSLCASGLIHVSDCSNFRRVAVRGSVTPELYRGFPR
ncbi:hypothetical protein DUQ00_19450 [Salmonella bongori]|nr:hypothetical protein [Salmonella bongori]ECC9598431.1 hypothetical protein [Salmonella bongori]EDP8660474.1 hypothetical protein [Salmonella bongori]